MVSSLVVSGLNHRVFLMFTPLCKNCIILVEVIYLNNNLFPDYGSALEPLINTQKRLATILSAYQLEYSKSIDQISEPLKTLSKYLASQANIHTEMMESIRQSLVEPLKAINQNLTNPYTEMLESIRQSQLTLFNEVSKLNKLYEPLNISDSLKISNIYSSIVNEASLEDILDNCDAELVDVKEVDKKPLTLELFLTIISVIIAIISTALTQLPDKQSAEIIDSLNQLIEIESQQLELLQQVDDNLSN